jgi:hypothetical protein
MSPFPFAGLTTFASPLESLVVLVAAIALLSLRAWSETTGLVLTKRVTNLLTLAIAALVILFFLLVAVRFKTLA